MADQKRPANDRPTIPFVSDAADAPDQEPPADANIDQAIAAEEALRSRHRDAGTIPQPRDDSGAGHPGAVKTRND